MKGWSVNLVGTGIGIWGLNNTIAWGTKTQYSTCTSACFICYPPPPR